MYEIGIWGQFGDGGKIADGQAVRTTIITNELRQRYGADRVLTANTNGWKKRKASFFLECVRLIRRSKRVLIAPADNGFKVFVPILMAINSIFHRELYYIVIGGFLPQLLKDHPRYKKLVNRFRALFVQTENLKKDLQALGVERIYILSNPKRLHTRSESELTLQTEQKLKLCVFSRIYGDKGVEDAIEAVRLANRRLGGEYLSLDLYGLLPDAYRERLSELLKQYGSFVRYCGIVDYDKTVETLKNYFLMLFPTYYHGEGFPGNVVDAYNSALPIIATDWLYNSDVIKDGRNGILVPIKDPEAIADAILRLYHDRALALQFAKNCLEDAAQYQPDRVLAEFYRVLES